MAEWDLRSLTRDRTWAALGGHSLSHWATRDRIAWAYPLFWYEPSAWICFPSPFLFLWADVFPPCSSPHPGTASLKKPSPRLPLPQTPVTMAPTQCDQLNCVPSNLHIEVLTPSTSECELLFFFFGNRLITVKMRSSWNKRGPLIQYDWCPYKKCHMKRKNLMQRWCERTVCKESQGLPASYPKLGERPGTDSHSPQKSSACRHFDLMASGLGENGDALLKLPSLWRFVTAALGR